MKRWRTIGAGLLFGVILTFGWDLAHAQTRPSSSKKGDSSSQEDFDRAVDLVRFRQGNVEWDTQELIASGLTALHREHVEIREELAKLKAAVERLRAKQ